MCNVNDVLPVLVLASKVFSRVGQMRFHLIKRIVGKMIIVRHSNTCLLHTSNK